MNIRQYSLWIRYLINHTASRSRIKIMVYFQNRLLSETKKFINNKPHLHISKINTYG